MDQNYDVVPLEISLRLFSSVKVISMILETYKQVPGGLSKSTGLVDEVRHLVQHLNSTKEARNMLETVIEPVLKEMRRWYDHFCFKISPIFTAQGTVDVTRSTRAVLEDVKLDVRYRFIVACAFCHEDQIFEIGRRLTANEISEIRKGSHAGSKGFHMDEWRELAVLWLDAYQGEFGSKPISGRSLPQKACDEGFGIALHRELDVAVRYFAGKASPERFLWYVEKYVIPDYPVFSLDEHWLSPGTYCYLFSLLDDAKKSEELSSFSFLVLHALLKWPYQRRFLEAARALTKNLSTDGYWELASVIASSVALSYRDCDYRSLFILFWQLGASHRRTSSICEEERHLVVAFVFLSKDEQLANMVLGGLSPDERKGLLLEFLENKICVTMMGKGWPHLLELFLRVCGNGNKQLLLQFKGEFLAKCKAYPGGLWFCDPGRTLGVCQWKAWLKKLGKMVDKILSEIPIAGAATAQSRKRRPKKGR